MGEKGGSRWSFNLLWNWPAHHSPDNPHPCIPAHASDPTTRFAHHRYAFPNDPKFSFKEFYERLNERGLVIYPGKVTAADCFRIGSIGQLYPDDMRALLAGIRDVAGELGMELPTS